jgi:hypothetical protein
MSITTNMNQQQRLDYIFNDMDGRTGKRFDWIYVLLDDVQTLIDGFVGYQNGKLTTFSRRGLGGGNVSIPILVCTGLELVSVLHAGKTAYPPFTGYNAIDNVERFVDNFFPIHARKIIRLMWEGVRNGVDHLFIPNAMTHGRVCIDFSFVLTSPSRVTKDNSNRITITINSIEFCLTLRNAIDVYRNRLQTDQDLQIKFINAWDSIKAKNIDKDIQKSKEVLYLLNELKQGTSIDLFQ